MHSKYPNIRVALEAVISGVKKVCLRGGPVDAAILPAGAYEHAGQSAVGFKIQGKTGHVVVDAEDALIAALKVRAYGVLSARAEARFVAGHCRPAF